MLLESANGALPSHFELPSEFQLYSNDVNLTKLKLQLPMLPDLVRMRNSKISPPIKNVTKVRTICDIMNELSFSKEMFSDVNRLLRIFYTMPVTTATAERTFSTLRRVKTYLRSTMSQERLNHTMLLHVHKSRTDELDDRAIARQFVTENDRRKHYFDNM